MGNKPTLTAVLARLDALEKKTFGHVRRRLSKRQVAELEGKSTRSVDRGVERGIYARPEIENGRCWWWSDTYRCEPATADTPEGRAARNPRMRSRKPAQASPEI
jgi:hypothetical protein